MSEELYIPNLEYYEGIINFNNSNNKLFSIAFYEKVKKDGCEEAENNFNINLERLISLVNKDEIIQLNYKNIVLKLISFRNTVGEINFEKRGFYEDYRFSFFNVLKKILKVKSNFYDDYVQLEELLNPCKWFIYPINRYYILFNNEIEENKCYKIFDSKNEFLSIKNFRSLINNFAIANIEDSFQRSYNYIIIPEYSLQEHDIIQIISGVKLSGVTGGGMTKEFIFKNKKLELIGQYKDWFS